uniref:Uncharacterized protein n=1 Tax=Candidatus Kentrum sp. LPFa TaxID=2126335 RepID=A0A450VZL6_9GAMM|nr:MAG: hypothetical protein BECKLPF1236B_GA0070989_101316 [Candidatus Kentron sp. LPFa]
MTDTNGNQDKIPPAPRGHKSAVTIASATAVLLVAFLLGIFEGEWETAVIMFVLVALLSSIVPYFKEDGDEFKEGDSKNAFRLFVNIPMGILFAGIIVFSIAYSLKTCEHPYIIAFIKWSLLVLAVFVTAVSMFITVKVVVACIGGVRNRRFHVHHG